MKYIKYSLFAILVLLTIMSVFSIILTLISDFQFELDLSKSGFLFFLETFKNFSGLYAGTIAVISVYYWIFQMNISQNTLNRIEKETIEKKKERALDASNFFYIEINPSLRELYKKVYEADPGLLKSNWELEKFTDESVTKQNSNWEKKYERVRIEIQDNVLRLNSMLEAFAAQINHGNFDEALSFKLFGKPFCTIIRNIYPFIAGYRSVKREQDYYNNIVNLYKKWSSKIT